MAGVRHCMHSNQKGCKRIVISVIWLMERGGISGKYRKIILTNSSQITTIYEKLHSISRHLLQYTQQIDLSTPIFSRSITSLRAGRHNNTVNLLYTDFLYTKIFKVSCLALESLIDRRNKVIFKVIKWFDKSVCFSWILFSWAFQRFLADGCNLRFKT